MSNPLFKVGEKVILQSPIKPHLNGVYFIKEHLIAGENYWCGISNTVRNTDRAKTCNIYLLDGCIDDGKQCYSNETSLRKYHEPSPYSFEDMMEKLNNLLYTQ